MSKKISIFVPCYNEEENVKPMAEALTKIMQSLVPCSFCLWECWENISALFSVKYQNSRM